jgi:exosortase
MARGRIFSGVNRDSALDAVRTTLAAVVALLLARLLKLPESYWAPISTIVIIQSTIPPRTLGWQRFVGTALGAVLGAALATFFSPSAWVYASGLILCGLFAGLLRIGGAYRFAGITLSIVLLIPHTSAPWIVGWHRFLQVSLGIAVALVVTIVWPARGEKRPEFHFARRLYFAYSQMKARFMSNSVEATPLLPAKESGWSPGMPRWQGAALLLLIVWLYASILERLFLQWINDPNFSHGIFVPLFALFVLWQDRKKLASIAAVPSWTGLPLVVLSLLMLVLGVMGAEIFSSRVSLLVLLAGLIVLFKGWTLFRAVLFPWAFLFLMIPIPNLILQQVTFPLQLLASKLATGLLELVGVPVLRQGNMIVLAAMPLDVAEACSGIRSLLTLVTLAIIYGYLMETRMWVRVVLVCSAVPIAVAANGFRIFGTGLLVQYWDPEKAEGFFHTFSGWLIFVVALILLFALHRAISLLWKNIPKARPA